MDQIVRALPAVHRPIRRVGAAEAGVPGELVTDGRRPRVRVDAAAVPEPLWRFAAAEHVAGVRDVLRRPDGQDALLPWCPERVEVFLNGRVALGRPLSAGEVVTLVGSVLRGIAEVARTGQNGCWWLDDTGRPVFVPGEGSGCAPASVIILRHLREGCSDRAVHRLLGEIVAGAADERIVERSIAQWERELTELAAPRALEREIAAPEPLEGIALHRAHIADDIDHLRARRALGDILADVVSRLRGPFVGAIAALHARVPARIAGAVGRRGAPGTRGRGRMLLAGAGTAAVVLIAGLLWPTGDPDDPATAGTTPSPPAASAASAASDGSGDATGAPPEDGPAASAVATEADAVGDGSIERRARELLAVAAGCRERGDGKCAAAIRTGSSDAVQDRLAGTDDAREVRAVEDYGDIAVVRLGPSGERGEQMLVLVRSNDEWLVRDGDHRPHQPSGQG